jgi:hypothetical protein
MPKIKSNRKIYYLGIDPGKSGGIAFIGESEILVSKMLDTESDICHCLSTVQYPVKAMIEKVGGYRAGREQRGSAMFNFGMNYGGLRMALIALEIPFEEVTPKRWQKAFGLFRAKTETNTQWKNRAKAKAQQLFPEITITLATADALLIAEYCRRYHQGVLQ